MNEDPLGCPRGFVYGLLFQVVVILLAATAWAWWDLLT